MMFAFSLLLLIVLCVAKPKPPNIIFILSDDLGYGDVGYQSHQINTPTLDKFRYEGQFLEWYYAQCVCTPTRSSFMSGMYPLHTGMNDVIVANQAYGLPLKFKLLPEALLQYANYETHIVGKWHLGFHKWAYTPTFRGFSSFYGYYTGVEDYYTHVNGAYDFFFQDGLNCGNNCSIPLVNEHNMYSTYLFTNRAIDIIRNHSESKTDNPLFLYLPYQSVHYPDSCPSQYVNAYNNSIQDPLRRLFAGILSCMDEGINNITDVLQELGYLNDNGNTVIIFSSDNGGPIGQTGTCNWPLRGGKDTVWEGGTKMTGFVWSTPDIIDYNKVERGSNYSQLMHIVDFYPTFLEAAGIKISDLGLNYTFDGISQWQGIIGNISSTNTYHNDFRDTLYYGLTTVPYLMYDAIQYKGYKLINTSGGGPSGWYPPPNEKQSIWDLGYDSKFELSKTTNISDMLLFNLVKDPTEHFEISKNNTQLVTQMYEMMIEFEKTGVPQNLPDPNCPKQTFQKNHVVGNVYFPWCEGYP